MRKQQKLTNAEIFSLGEEVDSYPSDVEGSNASVEHIVEYKGKHYVIVTDWDSNVRRPNDKAYSTNYKSN